MTTETTQLFVPSTIDGSTDRGGWQVSGGFSNSQSLVEYSRRAELRCLLGAKGTWEPNQKLLLQGYLLPDRITFDRKQSSTETVIATSDAFLNNASLQSIYFANIAIPTNPHQMVDLSLGKIVKHIIESHTNIADTIPGGWVDISGIDIVNSTTVSVYTVHQSTSIWQTIQDIASNEFYVRYFTKEDKLIYEPHPQFKIGFPNPVLTLSADNIIGQPTISFRNRTRVDQVKMYALTDQGDILMIWYPPQVGTEAKIQKYTNIRCNDLGRLNLLAERAFKYLNRSYNVTLSIPSAWGGYLELYDRISLTYSGTSHNGVTVAWIDKKFWISNIRITKTGNFISSSELDLEEEIL